MRVSDCPPLMEEQTYREECDKQQAYLLECDQRLHRAICCEIADFLGTNTAGFALLKSLKACLWIELMFRSPQEIKRSSIQFQVAALAGFLAGTHWATQINLRLSTAHSCE